MTDIQLVLRAISFAARAHEGHRRKDGATPYAAHPCRVLTILGLVFGVDDPEVLAAAVLHDTLEDTRTDWDDLAEQFSPRVAGIVAALSKDKRLAEPDREAEYLAAIRGSGVEVQLCKLADTLDNLIESHTLPAAARAKT